MSKFRIELSNRQSKLPCDAASLQRILEDVLREAADAADLSVAVVDDAQMQQLNRRFLDREGTTDVIAFAYGECEGCIEGEIVVNAEEAVRRAEGLSHGPEDELLLYAVHGALHLVGYDDAQPAQRRRMHERALEVLAATGRPLDSETLLEEQ